MKTILSIIALCTFISYKGQAQTAISSKKQAQTQTSSETTTPAVVADPATATLVSGDKQAVAKEVPFEKEATKTATAVAVPASSSKKPE